LLAARWRGHLQEMLPAKTKVGNVKHHGALPYADVPAFMVRLRDNDSISARALEFTVLNANRTGEAIGAKWWTLRMSAFGGKADIKI
jgi:hypothetical protein